MISVRQRNGFIFAAVINEKGVDGDVNSEGKPIVVKVYMNGELKDQATGLDANPYNPNDLGTSMIAFRHMGESWYDK